MISQKVIAFLKKDFLIESSYKASFAFSALSIFFSLLTYFFIDKLFGHRIVDQLQEFGVNYFSYVLLSMAFFSYIGVGLGSFSERIHTEQVQGTLEAVLLTPTRITTLLFALALWNLIFATIDMLIYICAGLFIFKINFANVNLLSTSIILFLTVTSFSALGIISASFIMVAKRGNPLSWFIATFEGILGGVYFPISVLPQWMQFFSKLFPVTYAIRAIELAVYKGHTPLHLLKEIGFLFCFSCVLLPASFFLFRLSIKRARKAGSLMQY